MLNENLNCEKTDKKKKSCHHIYGLLLFAILLFTFIFNSVIEPKPFLSSYIEALGNGQIVAQNSFIVFDPDSVDSVGDNIVLDASGTTFTINEPGLYLIEWDVNLAPGNTAVVGIIENGEAASGAASSASGNFSSGTLIEVDTVPFTISLYNYNNDIILENPTQWEDSAASIRILRFADGPSN